MSIPCLTVDGHYVELIGGNYVSELAVESRRELRKYVKGRLYCEEFPEGIITLWDYNHDHINNPNLNIARFQVGPEDREFQIRKEDALEYRKATNEPR